MFWFTKKKQTSRGFNWSMNNNNNNKSYFITHNEVMNLNRLRKLLKKNLPNTEG